MTLSDQRSLQRMIDEFMEDLTPRSPTGSLRSQAPPFPASRYVERTQSAGGHRRTHSSPGVIPIISNKTERGRTLSGGTAGRALNSDGLLSDINTFKKNSLTEDPNKTDSKSTPILSIVAKPALPNMQLPFILARSNRTPELQNALPALERPSPLILPPSRYESIPTTLLQTSSPMAMSTQATVTTSARPPTLPLPAQPVAHTLPHQRPSRNSFNDGSPSPRRFAAAVAMMEGGDSPTKRRSRLDSEEVLRSPTKKEKGKQRDEGERPMLPEGREQTPRRGLIGPGGIVPRIKSRSSLAKKVKKSQPSLRDHIFKPVIIPIPPSPPTTTAMTNGVPITPITPSSTTFLRPAPATPLTASWKTPKFAMSSSRNPSPSSSRQPTPTPIFAPRSGRDGLPPGPGSELVEIPRFKKKELNLGIVTRRGFGQRIAWLMLWTAWMMNGILSLFFDVNVIYILVQCIVHPSFGTNNAKSWEFATAAYIVLWAISTLVVWLGWEVFYEFWRRWRLPRPAVEPIFLSLPACLHLSLVSFNHFTFLFHIRTSPLSTPYARDIIPETCHFFLQLIPGMVPLLPRSAIAVVILISFWAPAADVQAPYGGAVDASSSRDSNFFRADSPGELTFYAKGVLLTFTVFVAIRLLVIIASGIGLWMFSGRPLGGLIGRRFSRKTKYSDPPTTPRKPKSSFEPRDPSTTSSPQKSWVDHENEFNWAWRERTRSRIQDAFELCMIRKNDNRLGSFLYQSEVPWGRMIEQPTLNDPQFPIEMNRPGPSKRSKPSISTTDFFDGFVDGKDPSRSNENQSPNPELARPESTLDPTRTNSQLYHSPSKANTAASSSATDLFYTPFEGNTPQTEKTRSVAENIHRLPPLPSPLSLQHQQKPEHSFPLQLPPPSSYRSAANGGDLTEFGIKEQGRISPESVDDESVGLLSASNPSSTTVSPKSSTISNATRDRSHSAVSQDHTYTPSGDSSSNSRSSSKSRRRAYTTSSPSRVDQLQRARSSSVTLLKESVANAAAVSGQLVRRARSGTVLSSDTGHYSKVRDKEEMDDDREIMNHGPATPRSRRGTGLGLGLPFSMPEKSE
ncbi:uncharacterized protein IL334_000775 [Kwoniella shivajii]|uniref:Uncharacterized protein n=1 Tax=Kwoniella shivajii TaxID=564305 RepID=A0ABZ1CQ27_9TREE|nr:hypothetical protein IL334_000775 [Kwoniella shivajii]